MEADKWAEEIINSLDGMVKAKVPSGLKQRVRTAAIAKNRISGKWIYAAAAAAVMLFAVNMKFILSTAQHKKEKAEVVLSEYNRSNQLY